MGRRRAQQTALDQQPEPKTGQQIAKILEVRGGGLYSACVPSASTINDTTIADAEVATTQPIQDSNELSASNKQPITTELLVLLPSKFQKLIWIKKGSFVIVNLEPDSKTKVKAEIAHVLFPDNIKYLKSISKWPSVFEEELATIVDCSLSNREACSTAEADKRDTLENAYNYESDKTDDNDLFINNNHGDDDSDEEV
ncbi:hypothetical protein BATDEDRAFT_23639 [Batrachochytrium dendrobatidis JAM81]|uniref:S1-like domain-containing protein n=2 Tax=Batrachochytrium dendrobatidis TaxID=109871 RepID=F4NXX2_BATDJ|nr:uncharacterized protein BATDEDRAFT_23639 [Batrachochytrium dendrobatidis JAM81]EGF82218.1 hypothetical protein BATDEDRAFT_23639 [Batrachochytrium dendrobatidis JAM81]KAJ8324464.1 putative RNA-binding protein eif1ad [Batrachochytrium dendrobatidis]KAK5670713.1 putative RNA-binding protein eif1ad [Batrachochytrium dendrobatidis]OAJ40618.1 hypothetical protein BDEG_24329 [Batrachochytrium dendrobatidis JEL423]|eukprot:XP_006677334.1 hypothetical protein BATDEDRAFT_23639 [Batrachochytrium dendrobatidis JAM81]